MDARSHWFSIRQPLPPRRALGMKIGAFVLPVVLWSIISYVPWVWHPMMRLTDVGESVYRGGDQLSRRDFAEMNTRLISEGKKPAIGIRANPVFLPEPLEVAKAMYLAFATEPYSSRDPWLHQSIWHSIQIIFWGFLASAAVGVPLGIMCGTFEFFSKLIEPFVDFIRYMPAPAFGALMVAIFGIEDAPKVAIIFIGTFFQMVLVVANTTRQVDVSLLEAAQTLGAKGKALVLRVIVPSILPNLYRDMRILVGWAWTYLIIAELIGAASGISYFINQQGKYRNYPNVYAGIIIIGLIGLATDQILGWLGPRLFPWTSEAANVKRWGIFSILVQPIVWLHADRLPPKYRTVSRPSAPALLSATARVAASKITPDKRQAGDAKVA